MDEAHNIAPPEQTTSIGEPPWPPDMAKLMALATKYGIDIHGPLPEVPEGFGPDGTSANDLIGLNHRWIQTFNDRDWETERAIRQCQFPRVLVGSKRTPRQCA